MAESGAEQGRVGLTRGTQWEKHEVAGTGATLAQIVSCCKRPAMKIASN